MSRRGRRDAGFTLTELMVVVAIIGVLATMAIVYMRPRVRSIDVANRFGDLVREASRRAVGLGPVRSDVAIALGSKARTRVKVTASSATSVTFTLAKLVEAAVGNAPPASWVALEVYTTDPNVLPASWGPMRGSGSLADLTAAGVLTTDWTNFESDCRPDGTCDSVSLFFQAAFTVPAREQFARVSIMPLGGAITTRTDWN